MAATMKILATLLLLLGIVAHGKALNCSLKDISVSQRKTGVMVKNKPEWMVTVENRCTCVQLNIEFNCNGFTTVEEVDPTVFRTISSDGRCLVNNGQPIYNEPVTFKYASDNPFTFTPIFSTIACSR